MQQEKLWYDRPEEALRDLIVGIGLAEGNSPKQNPYKTVGAMLFPDKSCDDAGRLVSHWCNPDRAEKPSLTELLFLMRKGHEHNVHLFMGYIATEVGYMEPVPINPDDQKALLQREYIEAVNRLDRISARIKGAA